jgi:hypothetical protein
VWEGREQMNKANRGIIREAVDSAAQDLEGRLPESPNHPKGRNPHAHVAQVLKTLLGRSYTECSDESVPKILRIIEEIQKNPF